MKTKRRNWILVTVAVALVGALAWAFSARPVPVEVSVVAEGPLRVTVDEDGRTRIRERYVVSAPLAGQLHRIQLHPGDAVEAGRTVVAVIEPAAPELLDARTRLQLEARLRAAETQLALSNPRIEHARATDELARQELARAMRLAEQNAVAAQELDRAREAARAAAEDVKAAEFTRQIAAFELEQARAALMRTSGPPGAEPCDAELRIASPVNGTVLRVFHEDAAVVATGARLVELGDPGDLEAEIDVLSSDAVRIRPGARVTFEHWGGEVPLEGRVRVVEPAGFLKISALGVEEQRVNVIVDLLTPPGQRRSLGDAYRVDARIVVWEAERVTKIPVGALFRSGGQWAALVVRDGRARLATLQVGENSGREVQILGGLAAGERVIVHPSDKVADGVPVKVR